MKVKGLSVVEVARALLASAKSRWVGGSASKMQGVILQKNYCRFPKMREKAGQGKRRGGESKVQGEPKKG